MIIDPEIALQLATLCLLVVVAVGILVYGKSSNRLHDDVIRLQTHLEEQGRQVETRGHYLEESIRLARTDIREDIAQTQHTAERQLLEVQRKFGMTLSEHETRFERRHGEALTSIQETLDKGYRALQHQMLEHLSRSTKELAARFDGLTETTDKKLQEISGQVEKRLNEGFERTTATFTDVVKRLALIDEAQKKITELSTNVVSLQEILSDKRSRGAYGEVQLNALVRNMIPSPNFAFQYTLPNDRVADCVLFLPDPTGTVAIDAKFPKESFDRMSDISRSDIERKLAEKQFKIDVRKHITDIAEKYIIPGTTSDGAVMFIPAEAVFAEIHAHHPDLVAATYASRVWMVSPTTLMAILNTARAVLKDEATRKQVHVIQDHLGLLAKDFDRFQVRMENLSKHIRQASDDAEKVHISAGKISARFQKIERVEIEPEALAIENKGATQKDTAT